MRGLIVVCSAAPTDSQRYHSSGASKHKHTRKHAHTHTNRGSSRTFFTLKIMKTIKMPGCRKYMKLKH